MFHCKFSVCLYELQSLNRLLNHVWDKHSLERGFEYDCEFLVVLKHLPINKVIPGSMRAT